MCTRQLSYPLNFNFTNELLLPHLPITRYLNELQSEDLITLDFHSGQLEIEFNHIFASLGFRDDAFEVTGIDGADKTLKEIMRGIVRKHKTAEGRVSYTNALFLTVLRNEDRNSPVIAIVTKFHELILQLRESGSQFILESRGESTNSYVSYLLASHWVERWYSYNNVGYDLGFWESVTYDGSLNQLRMKMKYFRAKTLTVQDGHCEIFFPRKRYIMIRDVVGKGIREIKISNYKVDYLLNYDLTISELQEYLNSEVNAVMHVIPHYLTYHIHRFNTEEDMMQYMEWSVFRSQADVALYTDSVTNGDGLRFTRGVIMSEKASSYLKFLNILLWNSYDFILPSTANDNLQWRAILQAHFHEFQVKFSISDLFISDLFPAPKRLREYIKCLQADLKLEHFIQRVTLQVLQNYISISYDSDFEVPRLQSLGRQAVSIPSSQPVIFSEIPEGGTLPMRALKGITFTQEQLRILDYKRVQPRGRHALLGGISTTKYVTLRTVVEDRTVLQNILDVRQYEYLRVLIKRLCPFDINQYATSLGESYLNASPEFVSFWYGLFLHYSKAELIIDDNDQTGDDENVTFGLQIKLRQYGLRKTTLQYNLSTPKLLSVLDTLFNSLGVIGGSKIVNELPELRRLFERTLILGGVDQGDPIGLMLEKYLNVTVRQVGAFGSGRTIRSEVSHFEFPVSFTAIISDLDLAEVETISDFKNFFFDIVFEYMKNVEPILGIWKVNYCTPRVLQYILNLIHDHTELQLKYVIVFITPQFGKVINYEKYLSFIRLREFRTTKEELKTRAFLPLPELIQDVKSVERQIQNVQELLRLEDPEFPRLYVFAQSGSTDVENTLSFLLHRMSRVTVVRGHGAQDVSYYGMVSPVRVRLCLRLRQLARMSQRVPGRFDVSHFGTPAYRHKREVNILGLGNYYREISRLLIITDLAGLGILNSLTQFVEYADDLHYVGIGDERARNIICVPPTSPYTIYDLKTHDYLKEFEIEYVQRYFPLNSLALMKQEVEVLYNKHDKKLVLFFTFVLFNEIKTKAELKEVLRLLILLKKEMSEKVFRIYLNFYIDAREFPEVGSLVEGRSLVLFNDIYLKKSNNVLMGTFSKHYDYVELLTISDINGVASREDFQVRAVYIATQHIHFMLWNLNYGLDPGDFSGLYVAQNFIPMLAIG